MWQDVLGRILCPVIFVDYNLKKTKNFFQNLVVNNLSQRREMQVAQRRKWHRVRGSEWTNDTD